MSDFEPPTAPAPLTAGRVGVYIECLEHGQNLPLPAYHSEGAAGMDLYAAVTTPITLHPGERALIATGICIAVPPGYEAQIRARSGNALYRGLGMVNAPGTIDSDYRGEIKAILINWGQEPQTIRHGDRIAQLVIAPVVRAEWIVVETLTKAEEPLATERGSGGFGHTGT